ncbi:MAG TPA: SRPBCC family protein [Mycobacteriales bacterium]|nr:SRPBCC family protein [Mycobacteriales bacterium]
MADQASSSITIAADPEAVLDVIRDVEAYPDWTGGIAKAVVLEPGAKGPKKVAFSMSQSGLSDEYTLLYDWQDDGVEWSLAEPSKLQKSQKGSYRLSGSGDSTQVTYLLTMDIKVPMIGLMKRKAEKMIIDSALKELKKRVESLN